MFLRLESLYPFDEIRVFVVGAVVTAHYHFGEYLPDGHVRVVLQHVLQHFRERSVLISAPAFGLQIFRETEGHEQIHHVGALFVPESIQIHGELKVRLEAEAPRAIHDLEHDIGQGHFGIAASHNLKRLREPGRILIRPVALLRSAVIILSLIFHGNSS